MWQSLNPHYHAFYLSASSIGSRLRSAVSLGSLNQDLMGIALSREQKMSSQSCQRDGHAILQMREVDCLRNYTVNVLLHYPQYKPCGKSSLILHCTSSQDCMELIRFQLLDVQYLNRI